MYEYEQWTISQILKRKRKAKLSKEKSQTGHKIILSWKRAVWPHKTGAF